MLQVKDIKDEAMKQTFEEVRDKCLYSSCYLLAQEKVSSGVSKSHTCKVDTSASLRNGYFYISADCSLEDTKLIRNMYRRSLSGESILTLYLVFEDTRKEMVWLFGIIQPVFVAEEDGGLLFVEAFEEVFFESEHIDMVKEMAYAESETEYELSLEDADYEANGGYTD